MYISKHRSITLVALFLTIIALSLKLVTETIDQRRRSYISDRRWSEQYLNLGTLCTEIKKSKTSILDQSTLVEMAKKVQDARPFRFQDPSTQLDYDWIIISSGLNNTSASNGNRIPVLAAPRWGPERLEGQYMRLVGFADGTVEWIAEQKFVEILNNN